MRPALFMLWMIQPYIRNFLMTKDVEIRSEFSLDHFVASSRPVLLWNARRIFEDEKYIVLVENGVTLQFSGAVRVFATTFLTSFAIFFVEVSEAGTCYAIHCQ